MKSQGLLLPLLGLATAASISRRSAIGSNIPAGWTYQGCFVDSASSRTLAGKFLYADNTTQESCVSFCDANGYNYAGVEYGEQCYCDYTLTNGTSAQEDDCSMACAGNSTETCGNGDRLNIFTNGKPGPVTNPGINAWQSLGCYTDSISYRALGNSEAVPAGASGMSVAQCTSACQDDNYSFAGVEYGGECWCDNAIRNGNTPASAGCNYPCSGNSSEWCGGAGRANIYQLPANSTTTSPEYIPSEWTPLGCYTDDASYRTLSDPQQVPGGSSNMTIENCLSVCESTGYAFGGLEYSQECYCGITLQNNGTCAADQTSCYQPCRGNTGETCGGPARLNLYARGSTSETPCLADGSDGSASSTTTALSTVTATPSTSAVVVSATTSSLTPASTTSTSTSVVTPSTSSAPVSSSTPPPSSSASASTSSSIKSSVPTSSTSTSSTSTSAAACTPTSTFNSGFVANGGFEATSSPWLISTYAGQVSSSLQNGVQLDGCLDLLLIPTSSPLLSARQVVVSQYLTSALSLGARYTFSMYVGRNTSASILSTPVIAVYGGAQLLTQFNACSGTSSCGISGSGGSVYQKVTSTFTALVPSIATLRIVVTWADANPNAAILLDDVSLVKA